MKNLSIARVVISAIFATLASAPLLASEMVLEEVTVTAQKREQSLQDVPISIIALAGDQLRSAGIEKLDALAPTIPAMTVTEGFGLDAVFIRGLGSGVNMGFEQAVGLVVDGIFYGRSRFGRSQFLDIERVEVLKGPQGALVGKNTTAGAILITSAKPTQEFQGWVTGNAYAEGFEGYSIEGALSGGVTDTISARFAFLWDDRDGYMDNLQTGDEDQGIEDLSARLSVLWEPNDSFNALLSWTYGDLDRQGRTLDVRVCDDLATPIAAGGPPSLTPYGDFLSRNGITNEDCLENYKRSADSKRNGIADESNVTEFNIFGFTMNWVFDNFTLSSLTGFAEYDYLEKGDNDRSPVEFLSSDLGEDYEQFSQELRLVSDTGGTFDWIAGVYYLHAEQDTLFNLHVNAVPPNGPGLRINRHIVTGQETDTYSAFGQLAWHFSDSWTINFDARFTHEEKDADQEQFPTEIYNDSVPRQGPGAGGPAGAFNVHSVYGDRTEDDFSPGVALIWDANAETMLYASAKRGFKGGGYDHNLSAGTNLTQDEIQDRFEYDEEKVTAFELGGKLILAEGRAQLNFALFRSKYDDLQVSALSGPGTFTVGNAASAISQGLEVDGKWLIQDNLTFGFAGAILDASYDKYDDAPCNFQQIHRGNCSDPVNKTQDLSGKTLQWSPDWSYSASLEHIVPVADNLEWVTFILLYGQDETALALDLDPNTFQDSWHKLDARVTLRAADGKWSVSLVGRNLTDKKTASWANDVPVFDSSYWSILEPPRVFMLQGTVNF
jgi:outer membrane receptor protein involved in Fe transport